MESLSVKLLLNNTVWDEYLMQENPTAVELRQIMKEVPERSAEAAYLLLTREEANKEDLFFMVEFLDQNEAGLREKAAIELLRGDKDPYSAAFILCYVPVNEEVIKLLSGISAEEVTPAIREFFLEKGVKV